MRKYKHLDEVTKALDSFDYQKVISFLTDDCYFQAGNLVPIKGKQEIYEMFNSFKDSLLEVTHNIDNIIEGNDSVVYYGNVQYKRKDGFELQVPVCDVFKVENNKIKEYYIFIDWSELLK